VVGDELLLTPLLGCNTWGGWGAKVTDKNLRDAAKAMVDTGLIDHGWQYINIDDGWQGQRGGPLLRKTFEWARQVNPSQPLSAPFEWRTPNDTAQFLANRRTAMNRGWRC